MTTDLPLHPAPRSQVYVLRVWHEPGAGCTGGLWRASVLDGAAGERRYFATLDALIDHLYSEVSARRSG